MILIFNKYIARDPFGVRPMYIGTNNEDIVVISSLLKQTEGFAKISEQQIFLLVPILIFIFHQ
jgi:asparagine synthetase B (glutamine-hydrolysing)